MPLIPEPGEPKGIIHGPSLEDTKFPFQNPYDLRTKHQWPMLDIIGVGAGDIWRPFGHGLVAPVGWLVVTCDKETARMPFDYKLVKWDGETLTEECGKMYAWAHNPYKTWRFIGDCCDV